MGEDVVKGRHPEAQHVPRMLKWDKVLKVVSRGNKIIKGERDLESWTVIQSLSEPTCYVSSLRQTRTLNGERLGVL